MATNSPRSARIGKARGLQPLVVLTLAAAFCFESTPAYSREEFLAFAGKVLDLARASAAHDSLDARVQVSRSNISGALANDPLTLTATSQVVEKRPLSPEDLTPRQEAYLLRETLAYRDLLGLRAQVGVEHTFSRESNVKEEKPNGFGGFNTFYYDRRGRDHTVTGSAAYDLVKGGRDGVQMISARSGLMTEKAQLYSTVASRQEFLAGYFRLAADIYSTQCHLQYLRSTTSLVEAAIREGEVRLKTNALSYKDFLNVKGLKLSVEQNVLTNLTTIRRLVAQTESLGKEAADQILAMAQSTVKCDVKVKETMATVEALDLNAATLWERHPSIASARASKRAALLRLEAQRLQRLPTFGPGVSFEWSPRLDEVKEDGKVSIEMTLNWDVPGGKQSATSAAAAASLAAATASETSQIQSIKSSLTAKKEEIRSQAELLQLIDQNVANADETLQALKAQQLVGGTDSVTFANAYLRKIEAENLRLRTWASLEKLIFDVQLIAAGDANIEP